MLTERVEIIVRWHLVDIEIRLLWNDIGRHDYSNK